jgi:transcriptional regulator with XRE-family HTH domain
LRFLRNHGYGLRMGHAGTAIRAMRQAQGLSVRELARLAEVNHSQLSQVERGLKDPSPRWLKSVTDALGRHLGGAA